MDSVDVMNGTPIAESPIKLERELHISDRMEFTGTIVPDNEIVDVNSLGRGLRLVSEHRGELNHAKAMEILELPEFIVNDQAVDRNLRDAHVSYLNNCMKRGTFHHEWVTIITCACDENIFVREGQVIKAGTEVRMNGQHCCWATLGMPPDYTGTVRFQRYHAKTLADMRQLYASIDRNAVRNASTVMDSLLQGTEQFIGLQKSVVRILVRGLGMWLHDDRHHGQAMDADSLACLIQTDWRDLTDKLIAFLKPIPPTEGIQWIYRVSVIAAMFETFNKVPTKALEFWNPVVTGLGFQSASDPRKRLHDFLVNSVVMSSASTRNRSKKQVTQEELYRVCINAWNSWRKGNEIKGLRSVGGTKRPKAQ